MRNGFEQEIWFCDLVGIKNDQERITRSLKFLACMFNIACLRSTTFGPGHTADTQFLRQHVCLFPVRPLRHTPIVTHNDRHSPMRISRQVRIAGGNDPFQRRSENRDALVDSGDKDKNWMLCRIFTLLNLR